MRFLTRILKWLGYFAVAVVAAGAIYQQAGSALDRRLAPPASQMIMVEGHAVHFACIGEGPRTYLLDAGAGVWSFEFGRLKPLLAKSGRVCTFDRPGLGWSEDMQGGHDAASLAAQVFKIVHAAKIATPFIYVGHSLGANVGEIYLDRYPQDLAALVLLEPGFPKWLLEQFPMTRAEAMASAGCNWQCDAALVAGYLGVSRLAAAIARPGAKSMTPEMAAQYQAGLARPQTLRTIVATLRAVPKTAYQIMDIKSFGQTPVLTIASERPIEPDEGETPEHFAKTLQEERDYLTARAALSSRGAGVIVIPNSNHSTMVTGDAQAAATARAIEGFVAGIDAAAAK
jgi:pimeloyl-ACP methyl ester carboxylesterase